MASSIWVPRMSRPVRVRGRRRQSLSMLAAIKTRPTACGVGAHKQYVGPLINIVHSILTANTSHLSCTGNRHEGTYDWTVKSIPGRKPVERSTTRPCCLDKRWLKEWSVPPQEPPGRRTLTRSTRRSLRSIWAISCKMCSGLVPPCLLIPARNPEGLIEALHYKPHASSTGEIT